MNIKIKTLVDQEITITSSTQEIGGVCIADLANTTMGIMAIEFLGSGSVTLEYTSSLTKGESTWYTVDTMLIVNGVRKTMYMPSSTPHFGKYYEFRLSGTAVLQEVTLAVV